ncbi:MAG: ferritin-like domain-containing protein [Bacteroidetes bacterium]|nr:ferritin-like domain-containing protein [Bacteroidota bacterium]
MAKAASKSKKSGKKTAAKKSAAAKKTAPRKAPAKTSTAGGKKSLVSKIFNQGQDSEESMLMEFFSDELKDIYWAEKHLTKTLPKMQKAATSDELKQAFADHLETTQTHVERLEEIFELLGKKAQAKKCDAMAGITEEGAGIIEETEKGTATRDVGLILSGQKVEHYEIATYGGLAQLAKTLGLEDVASLLEETLAEEKEADELLTQIAENNINIRASEEDEDEEGEEEEEEDSDEEEGDEEEEEA